MNISTMGNGFTVFFRLFDNIFKTDNRFEMNITSSTGKQLKAYSFYGEKAEYTKLEIDNSAVTIVLDFIIQRKDNYEVISTGYGIVKYDDIDEKLEVLDFKAENRKVIVLHLTNPSNQCFNLEIKRSN